ncbi:MAG: hypothetical protein VB012_02655 [Erysipelotrichaceae bacterium]|nr:hypothetical protein [Erysipelotrichaceae bacterium]
MNVNDFLAFYIKYHRRRSFRQKQQFLRNFSSDLRKSGLSVERKDRTMIIGNKKAKIAILADYHSFGELIVSAVYHPLKPLEWLRHHRNDKLLRIIIITIFSLIIYRSLAHFVLPLILITSVVNILFLYGKDNLKNFSNTAPLYIIRHIAKYHPDEIVCILYDRKIRKYESAWLDTDLIISLDRLAYGNKILLSSQVDIPVPYEKNYFIHHKVPAETMISSADLQPSIKLATGFYEDLQFNCYDIDTRNDASLDLKLLKEINNFLNQLIKHYAK